MAFPQIVLLMCTQASALPAEPPTHAHFPFSGCLEERVTKLEKEIRCFPEQLHRCMMAVSRTLAQFDADMRLYREGEIINGTLSSSEFGGRLQPHRDPTLLNAECSIAKPTLDASMELRCMDRIVTLLARNNPDEESRMQEDDEDGWGIPTGFAWTKLDALGETVGLGNEESGISTMSNACVIQPPLGEHSTDNAARTQQEEESDMPAFVDVSALSSCVMGQERVGNYIVTPQEAFASIDSLEYNRGKYLKRQEIIQSIKQRSYYKVYLSSLERGEDVLCNVPGTPDPGDETISK